MKKSILFLTTLLVLVSATTAQTLTQKEYSEYQTAITNIERMNSTVTANLRQVAATRPSAHQAKMPTPRMAAPQAAPRTVTGVAAATEELEYRIILPGADRPMATLGVTANSAPKGACRVDAVLLTDDAYKNTRPLQIYLNATMMPSRQMLPVSASQTIIRKDDWRMTDYVWDHARNMLSIKECTSKDDKATQRQTRPETRDLLSLLWHIRWRSYPEGDVPPAYEIIIDGKGRTAYQQSCLRYEAAVEDTLTNVLEVTIIQSDRQRKLVLAMTDDSRRIPLMFAVTTPEGTTKGVLMAEEQLTPEEADIYDAWNVVPEKHPVRFARKEPTNRLFAKTKQR